MPSPLILSKPTSAASGFPHDQPIPFRTDEIAHRRRVATPVPGVGGYGFGVHGQMLPKVRQKLTEFLNEWVKHGFDLIFVCFQFV
jgi:hypothetical protein